METLHDTANQNTAVRFSQASTLYDPAHAALWMRTRPTPRPCYNPDLLEDILSIRTRMQAHGNILPEGQHKESLRPAEYFIMASDLQGVFMLGGDLALFADAIEREAREELMHYGRICIDVVHALHHSFFQPLTTVALVQGECLGGGFEAALAHDIIVAEEQARFGFPEIRFNLFPGMGATSFLERRIGRVATMRLLEDEAILSAKQMQALGIVDIVVPNGAGVAEVERLICRRKSSRNGLEAMARARRRIQPVEYQELLDIVEIWVEAALRLTPRDLRTMRRFAQRQNHAFPTQQSDLAPLRQAG